MSAAGHWPVRLAGRHAGSDIVLRALHPRKDRSAWVQLRRENADWTRRWDSTSPYPTLQHPTFSRLVREQHHEARAGRLRPFAIEVDGQLSGQIHLFNVVHGALQSGAVGYWISERVAGKGITPFALALVVDHAFEVMALHRIEVNIRPDNMKSLRVVRKLGLRDEGIRERYLHINGDWHDHRTFALTTEDLDGESALERLDRLSQQSF